MSMIHLVPKSKKEQKSISRQVNLAITLPPPTTEYLNWSDHPIKFSREDHPPQVPQPGHTPMVPKYKSEDMMLAEYSWTQGAVST
jgi:hypothetical protein